MLPPILLMHIIQFGVAQRFVFVEKNIFSLICHAAFPARRQPRACIETRSELSVQIKLPKFISESFGCRRFRAKVFIVSTEIAANFSLHKINSFAAFYFAESFLQQHLHFWLRHHHRRRYQRLRQPLLHDQHADYRVLERHVVWQQVF